MDEIISILMRRDDLSYNEASNLVSECQEAIKECIDYANESHDYGVSLYNDITEIVYDYLGLEPDYMEYLLYD